MVLADFDDYLLAQHDVAAEYARPLELAHKSILNIARVGYFSSDRAVSEYCKNIWNVNPVELRGANDELHTSYPPPARLLSPQPPRHSAVPKPMHKPAENAQAPAPARARGSEE